MAKYKNSKLLIYEGGNIFPNKNGISPVEEIGTIAASQKLNWAKN